MRVLLGATLALVSASCGSGASPAPERASKASEVASTVTSGGTKRAAAPVVEATEAPTEQILDENRGPRALLCDKDPVAFDLSNLQSASVTPPKFWYAWEYAKSRGEMPGFVVELVGTSTGPIRGRVGAVHIGKRAQQLEFSRQMRPTDFGPVFLDPQDPTHVIGTFGSLVPFLTAFGEERSRDGFWITTIRVDGHLDSMCRALTDVSVAMYLPQLNRGQRFGNMTIDEALGEPTVDSDGDGSPDTWVVEMAAPRLESMTFGL
jgi:hypothetical protein